MRELHDQIGAIRSEERSKIGILAGGQDASHPREPIDCVQEGGTAQLSLGILPPQDLQAQLIEQPAESRQPLG